MAHRDIKPDNLLIYQDGTLRISDFGCARLFDPGKAPGSCMATDTIGTPAFQPPEASTCDAGGEGPVPAMGGGGLGASSEEQLTEACRDADVILHCYTPITSQVLRHAERLRGIVKYGVGIDAIDIVEAKKRGVPVANIPEYGEETVAEGAFMLMIGLAKKFKPLQRQMQSQGWAW